ncbi:hypothetical protein BDZ91DRAFT_730918 [Kalaharituber pfeilii]|nr:hypothetical protein BDZ91DRAFT_730918 [Kalaharituber pfeilii]
MLIARVNNVDDWERGQRPSFDVYDKIEGRVLYHWAVLCVQRREPKLSALWREQFHNAFVDLDYYDTDIAKTGIVNAHLEITESHEDYEAPPDDEEHEIEPLRDRIDPPQENEAGEVQETDPRRPIFERLVSRVPETDEIVSIKQFLNENPEILPKIEAYTIGRLVTEAPLTRIESLTEDLRMLLEGVITNIIRIMPREILAKV